MKKISDFLKGRFRFKDMQLPMILFGMLVFIISIQQRNISYRQTDRILEPYSAAAASAKALGQQDECLIIWEGDAMGQMGRDMMEEILDQMKIPYTSIKGSEKSVQELWKYSTVVFSMTHFNLLDESVLDLMGWVRDGGNLMILYPPVINGTFHLIADELGIQAVGNQMEYIERVAFENSFMINGGAEGLTLPNPYESSLQVHLLPECTVYLRSGIQNPIPLIWSYRKETGTVVFCNLGHLEKEYRGFYSASYSLLGDYCVWPVINGSAFYLDDFPAPVPMGENKDITAEYGARIEDFYKQIWWNDLHNLAEKYGIRYTGLAVENYTDQVEAPFERLLNSRDFRFLGSMLLEQGGEIGFHGYNHLPLFLNDGEEQHRTSKGWKSYEDMKKGMQELASFCHMMFPQEQFHVYAPPENILPEEGRRMLKEEFPDILAIAGAYFVGDTADKQEFTVREDGLIDTPRLLSGYKLDENARLIAISELNFHYVNSHYQHFSDVLSGLEGKTDWKELLRQFTEYVDWLYTVAPDIRKLTGTEMAGAVQRYDQIQVLREKNRKRLTLSLGYLADEAWFLLRANEGKPREVRGGSIQKLSEEIYLLKADTPQVVIEFE